jgi:class 3 adenylate cyclase/tRNA A-37 threonylcarbamoyl transferase component Bud32
VAQDDAREPCPRCGGANPATAKFCGHCGAKVSEIVCAECGTRNDRGQRFCHECGALLQRGAGATSASPAAAAPEMPKAFARGRYEVVRFLGEGGRKRVYLAHDALLQREVAVSAFKSEGVDEQALTRARREAEAMGRLGDHPNVVTVHDIGEDNGALFLVSQFMSGGDLAGLLAQAEDRRLAVDEVVRVARDVARALEHAHAHGVIHRDIKPQNVWLAPDGTAKLGDFGLALAADRSRLTIEGMMVGTVAYMPPEQGLGRSADARSDLYSLGAVMYEALSGVPPFVGGDAAAIISQHVSMTPVAPSWHRSDVPRPLETLVLKLLAKAPEDRPQSAAEAGAALDAVAAAASGAGEPQRDVGDALDRLTEGTFLGRERETKDLRTAIDEVVAGRGRVSVLAGEAGIGKTRLASEVAAYAELRGAQVLWGRCYEGEGSPAYWPWVQVIRAYAQTRDPDALKSELGSGASDVAQVVSELRERLPDLAEPPALDPEHARFRLFDSISSFLRNASSGRPLVIVLEDLHLADKPSLLLLQFVARELHGTRILLLCTFRDAELDADHPLHDVQASLSHTPGYQRIRLRGLSKREVFVLLQEVSRQSLETPDELAFADAVYEESGGNPYFIEELIRHLVESGVIYQRDGRWVSDARHIEDLGIPQGIRDVVARRMSRLSAACREVLAVAAAIGQEFPLQVLERVSELPGPAVFDRVREAVDAAILAPVPDQLNRYRFAQVAIRDALYRGLPTARRVDLHRAIGEALEELYEDRLESHLGELAHHFAKAATGGVAAKAVDYAWWAGEHATALAAYEDAVAHFARALQLFDTLTDDPVHRCELLLALGDAQWRAGEASKARDTFTRVLEISEPLALSDQYARAALGYGGGGHSGFSVADRADPKLVEHLRTALRALPDRDSLVKARVLARLALELRITRDHAQADAVSRRAVEMAERLGDASVTLLAMDSRAWATKGPDGLEESLATANEIVRLAHVVVDREMEFRGHHLRLDALLQLGDMPGVDEEIRACERLAKEMRQPNYDWQVAVFRVMRALMQGRMAEADRLAQAAFSLGQRWQPEQATIAAGVHTFIRTAVAGGMAALEEGGEAFAQGYPHGAWPAALVWLLSEIGERAKARAKLDALARDRFGSIRRDANWLTAVSCLSWACDYLEDADAAEVLYADLAPYADRCVSILAGTACVGSTHLYLGNLAKAAGRLDAAADHYAAALEVDNRIGAHCLVPRTYRQYARTVLARGASGDRRLAAELIERGLESARRMGVQAEVETLLSLRLRSQGMTEIDAQTSIDAVARSVEETRPDLRSAAAPDGTVTIMFSDIEDSTVLTEQLGDRRWLALLRRHNDIVRRQVAEHGGYEVKSQGDGFMIAFASARRAIRCAIDVQRALDEHRRGHPDEHLSVRIGLHTGEAMRSDEDFFGKNVILAARIAARARGDEILVSSLLHELVVSAGEFDFGEERELELKGLTGRYRVFDVPWLREPVPPAYAA